MIERGEGRKRPTRADPIRGTAAAAARARGCSPGARRRGATRPGSPPVGRLLPERRQLELAQELHLVAELDAELLEGAAARLSHQGERVDRAGAVGILDEVCVL